MTPDDAKEILGKYLAGELPLDEAASACAKWEIEGAWHLYSSRGTPEVRERFEALQRRARELVTAWRAAHGDSAPPSTA